MLGAALAAVNARVGRRWLIWAALTAIFAVVLDFLPLFNLLGYDFSFALGLLVALASVDIGCGVVRAARRREERLCAWRACRTSVLAALAILVVPLLLSLLNAARVRNCNVLGGLAFFALLPLGTAVYGAGAGALAGLLFPRRGRLVAFLIPLVSVAWTLARLYRDPAVFAFDPFGGYFPGPIYDEAMRAPLRLVEFRVVNLLWLVSAIAVVHAALSGSRPRWDLRRWPLRRALVAGLLTCASLALFAARGELGFHIRKADLLRVLDGERHSNRIVLRYPLSGGPSANELALTMDDLEFRYDQLRDILGVEPAGPITVYQFASSEMKKDLVGAATTLYAKPWTREIFVQAAAFPSNRLRHEMAHVFAGAFGDRFFGVAFTISWKGPFPVPRLASGLIEGVAETADFTDPDGGSTTHQEAAAMIADGRAPPLADVIGAGFSALSGPRAYTLAGSFCRFLFDTRGAERLRALYHSAGDFQGVYGQPLSALEAEWRGFLARQPMSAEQRARAREQFRRPAIFKKICAREQAARVVEARNLIGAAPARAVRLLEQACSDDPMEPTLEVELAQAVAATGDATRALALLAAVARDGDATSPVRARAANLAAAIYFHANDFDNARGALREVLAAATDEGERRTANAKLRALDDEPARRTLGRALFGDDATGTIDPVLLFHLFGEFARLHPDERLGPYLIGRQLAPRDPQLALPYLRAASEGVVGGAPLSPDFQRECQRMLMLAAFRLGDLARSHAAATALLASATDEAERLRAGDFLARIAWRRSKQ
ncbi:MAG TPA: hypothetical protein VGP07_08200 [Polyangia bacterium]|jgi:tetratricopeptide (TPR) repeat protein